MPTSCPTCLAEFSKPRPPGSKCPECGARLPGDPVDDEERDEDKPRRRRHDEDEDDDDRPRRRKRRDDDSDVDDRPARRRPAKKSGVGKVLLILGILAAVPIVLCCGGYFAYVQWGPKPVKTLDATRHKTPDGGTASVTINVRVDGSGPGGFVRGDYYFNFKSGGRTSVHNVGLIGQSGEFRSTFATPELMQEKGSVEFWVERRDGSSVTRVSDYHTIR